MTRPAERTLSTLWTLDFLHKLARRTDVPDDVRETAKHLIRHFPTGSNIKMIVQSMEQNQSALFPPLFCIDDPYSGQLLQETFSQVKKYDFT